jgi:hypothetical protein
VTDHEPYLIVLEFLPLGSLRGYLHSEYVKNKLDLPRMIKFAGDVASGMFYLQGLGFVVS